MELKFNVCALLSIACDPKLLSGVVYTVYTIDFCLTCSVSVVLSVPMYGSLLKAWQCFFSSTEHLSFLHASISHSLISEDGQHIRSWQKDAFKRKMFCGFRESRNLKREFGRAQKPWIKKLKKVKMCFKYKKLIFHWDPVLTHICILYGFVLWICVHGPVPSEAIFV